MLRPPDRAKRHSHLILIAAAMCLVVVPRARAAEPTGFNGGRAFEDLKHLVGFGPRPSGSPALTEARQWLVSDFAALGHKWKKTPSQPKLPSARSPWPT